MYEFHEFKDLADLTKAMTDAMTSRFQARFDAGQKVNWAVSGGSTPAPLFQAMSGQNLGWENVHICLVDERWVPPSHPRSNETFMREKLLVKYGALASFTPMWDEDFETIHDAAPALDARYKNHTLPFTSVLLGMGPDGHTASLFPDAEGLEEAFDLTSGAYVTALHAKRSDVTGGELDRVSLTARAIVEADHTALMITGDEKRGVFESAVNTGQNLPIGRLINLLKKPLNVYWAP